VKCDEGIKPFVPCLVQTLSCYLVFLWPHYHCWVVNIIQIWGNYLPRFWWEHYLCYFGWERVFIWSLLMLCWRKCWVHLFFGSYSLLYESHEVNRNVVIIVILSVINYNNEKHLCSKLYLLCNFQTLCLNCLVVSTLTVIHISQTLHIIVKALLTQFELMRALFLLGYLGTSLVGPLLGKCGKKYVLTYSLEITVCWSLCF